MSSQSPVAKQSCTQQLERQHAESNSSLTEIGCPLPLRVQSDSAAARGMMTRRGSGGVKHLDIKSTLVPGNNREGAIPNDEVGQ